MTDYLPTTLWDHDAVATQWIVVMAAALLAAVCDVRTGRIPNALSFPLFFAGMVWAGLIGGCAGLGDAMLGAVLAMTPFVFLFVFAGGGAGDAKLMGAVGAWLGVIGGFIALASVMIAGGVIGVVGVIVAGKWRNTWANLLWILSTLRDTLLRRAPAEQRMLPSVAVLHTMPYGVPIFVGVSAAFGAVALCGPIA